MHAAFGQQANSYLQLGSHKQKLFAHSHLLTRTREETPDRRGPHSMTCSSPGSKLQLQLPTLRISKLARLAHTVKLLTSC